MRQRGPVKPAEDRDSGQPGHNRAPTSQPSEPTTNSMGTAGPLTRVNVNLTQRTVAALDSAVAKTGDSRTDTINRAIQVYDLVQDLLRNGDGRSLLIKYPSGESERVFIM